MIGKSLFAAVALASLASTTAAEAHHSLAAFFDDTKLARVTGVVESYRFVNPHGSIVLLVQGGDGKVHRWRAETSAPVYLERRGWSATTLQAGQHVTIEGYLARNGQRYIRLRQAYDENGAPVVPDAFGFSDD